MASEASLSHEDADRPGRRGVVWSLGPCLAKPLPGHAEAAGPRPHFENHLEEFICMGGRGEASLAYLGRPS